MLRITLGLMRRSTGRLIAAGLAVLIGTAFVASTLLASDALKRASYDAATAPLAQADLVAGYNFNSERTLTLADLNKVAAVPGVKDVAANAQRRLTLTGSERRATVLAIPTSTTESLQTYVIDKGRAPVASNEIALTQGTLDRLHLSLGSTVSSTDTDAGSSIAGAVSSTATPTSASASASEPAAPSSPMTWTVVGVVSDPHQAWSNQGTIAAVSLTGLSNSAAQQESGNTTASVNYLLISLKPGADATVVAALAHNALGGTVSVTPRDQIASQLIAGASGGQNLLTAFILGFAAVAMLVAALVIANTFQVLVAQRTRTLALLRCAGASRRQLRRSVLMEAGILGLIASTGGLIIGALLTQGVLVVLRQTMTSMRFPETIHPSVASVLVPIAVGTVVTVIASLVPAREATRVAPLAALQPIVPSTIRSRAGKFRAGISIVLVLVGVALLAWGVSTSKHDVTISLLVGIAGGTLSFIGIVLGATYWVPPVARGFAAVVSKIHPTARLAAANVTRNPRRTVATSTALLIGVTLVSMMSVGAASARVSLNSELDSHFAVDMRVTPVAAEPTSTSSTTNQLTNVSKTVQAVSGVRDIAVAHVGDGLLSQDHGTFDPVKSPTIVGITPDDATRVMRDAGDLSQLTSGVIMLSAAEAKEVALKDGDHVVLGADAQAGRAGTSLTVQIADVPGRSAYVTPDALQTIPASTQQITDELFVALEPDADALATSNDVTAALNDNGLDYFVFSPAADRQQYSTVIDTVLAVIVGLLAVAVVIALIGVANTLSLSVLERRRESATLRAIGLKRRQLRSMLAIEGMFISGIGALLGVVLGLIYGWLGSMILLGSVNELTLVVPWSNLGLIMVVGLVAGLLASVMPARSAAKTPPVAALAVE